MQHVATLIVMALSQAPQKTLLLSELRKTHFVKHLRAYHIVNALSHLKDNNEIKIYYKGVYQDGSLTHQSWESPSDVDDKDTNMMYNLVTVISIV